MFLALLLYSLLSVIGVILLFLGWTVLKGVIKYNLTRSKYSHIPRVNFGSIRTAMQDGDDGFVRAMKALRDSKTGEFFPLVDGGPFFDGSHYIVVSQPQVLSDNRVFIKHPILYGDWLHLFAGSGLITADFDHWESQRKLLNPLFQYSAIMHMVEPMSNCIREYMTHLRSNAGQVISVPEDAMKSTFMKVLLTLIVGGKFDADQLANQWKVFGMNRYLISSMLFGSIVDYFGFLFFEYRTMKKTRALIRKTIQQKRSNLGEARDLISMMLSVKDPQTNKELISEELIEDNCMTFMLAGQETSLSCLSWIMYYVGLDPDVENKILQEIKEVVGNKPVTEADIQHFKYITSVIKETLRIQPIIPELGRYNTEEVVISGYKIPKNSTLGVLLYAAHHSSADSDIFNPDRPMNESSYFPFSMAPRSCIGNRFAMQELIIFLVELYRNFHVELVEPQKVFCVMQPTAQPKHLKAKFISRT